ncbi:cysteine peptidase family C39 domain-containing protein [Clostridium sp. 1001271st1 H5]|uniref:cysteine peptidase family C39 domain-containing protein n=1 Tax=unclassified Clostridium TaxID=2614128 RepID=UPI002432997B|nr:cysteine peptidase family C39 domain-containing protein [Clostridium sp. 1001271st1 H5]
MTIDYKGALSVKAGPLLLRRYILKISLILQEYPYECGVACLAMIGAFHGKSIKLEEYRKLFNCPTQRQSFDDICKAAAKISLETTGIKIKELKDSLIFPCIGQLEITEGSLHFVVIYSVGENIVIADPARGLRQIPNDIFNKIFFQNFISNFRLSA